MTDQILFLCFTIFNFWVAYNLGKYHVIDDLGEKAFESIVDRSKFPVTVAEKIDGHFYLYEKDTTNFLCQAPTLEELPKMLLEAKNITLAVIYCPEVSNNKFWCLNGKLKRLEDES